MTLEDSSETDVPAEQARSQTPARLSRAHGDQERPAGAGPSAREGPQASVGLTAPDAALQRAAPLGRLTKRAEFLRARQGLRASCGVFLIEAALRGDDKPARVGFTATKKLGSAVVRNRAKRRMREAARLLLAARARNGVDYVLIARNGLAEAPWERLLDDLSKALLRLDANLAAQMQAHRPAAGDAPPT